MQQFVFVPLIVIVVGALVWTWWAGRSARDPISSVDSFNRALTAMQPSDHARGGRGGEAPGPVAEGPSEVEHADDIATTDVPDDVDAEAVTDTDPGQPEVIRPRA